MLQEHTCRPLQRTMSWGPASVQQHFLIGRRAVGAGVMLAALRADTDIVNVVASHPDVRPALCPLCGVCRHALQYECCLHVNNYYHDS